MMPVGGSAHPRFARVTRAFEALGDPGSAVAVAHDGEFGMGGIGGCDAFVSPTKGYAYAYVTRCLGDFDRSERLIEALEECL